MPRAWKVCTSCGDPVPPGSTRCTDCRSEHERRRGTPAERGYDAAHRRARREWAPKVAAGSVTCARCREPIEPGTPWALDHDDHDRSKYLGPSHADCNNAAGGHAAARYKRPPEEPG